MSRRLILILWLMAYDGKARLPETLVTQPISYSGSGDDVIFIQKPGAVDGPVIVYVRGNHVSEYFAVTSHDASGTSTNLLVNTTEVYEGIVPLDFLDDEVSTMLEVNATGDWYIEIRPLDSARVANVPGAIDGFGDEVFIVTGSTRTAYITGNSAEAHFAVSTYGTYFDLAVNTADPYAGRVIIPVGTNVVGVSAEGSWTIVFE